MIELSPAFTRELIRSLQPAFGLALGLTKDRVDAEDLVQDAALSALRAWHTFEPGTNFGAWFACIVRHCHFADYRRHRRRGRAVAFDEGQVSFDSSAAMYSECRTHEAGPWRTVVRRLEAEAVRDAVAALPADYRAVATLYLVDDRSYRDIAFTLGIPVGTVRSRLHRARLVLRARLRSVAA